MAKTETPAIAEQGSEKTTVVKMPRIGELIKVKGIEGQPVVNMETGVAYDFKKPTATTVTVRIIKLLEHGDLIRE